MDGDIDPFIEAYLKQLGSEPAAGAPRRERRAELRAAGAAREARRAASSAASRRSRTRSTARTTRARGRRACIREGTRRGRRSCASPAASSRGARTERRRSRTSPTTSGRIQLYFKKDELGDDATRRSTCSTSATWSASTGPLFRTRTGEVTVRVAEVELLAKSLRPLPFGKEEVVDGVTVRHSGFADPEQRYRQRYADLAVHPGGARAVSRALAHDRARSARVSTAGTTSRSRRRCCSRCTAARRRVRS